MEHNQYKLPIRAKITVVLHNSYIFQRMTAVKSDYISSNILTTISIGRPIILIHEQLLNNFKHFIELCLWNDMFHSSSVFLNIKFNFAKHLFSANLTG